LDIVNYVYHVMARGIEGQEVFRDDHDREAFLGRLGDVVTKGGARLYAWCLMPNHFHLLVRPKLRPLSWMMRRLMTGYAVAHNMRHGRKGHLFQNRYRSFVVEEKPYLLELVRYIHLNPVRAGMIGGLEELDRFPYTGHSVIVGERDCPWQDVGGVLEWLADSLKKGVRLYRYFVAAGFKQGPLEEFRGGGLARSAGGMDALRRRPEQRHESSDERVLGSGEFVEKVWRAEHTSPPAKQRNVDEILEEVSKKRAIAPERILGASRERVVSRARREFFLLASEEAGASMAALARLAGRSHVAVRKAVELAREERRKSG
jgi:REP element-mobilizing transposase RayT